MRPRAIPLATAIACVLALGPGSADRTEPWQIGAAAVWQKLLKLRTTASAMHTTAHPDDEHGGLLAMLSHGQGVDISMLTLTRGESGDNAIGSELFDALGLIRTEELLLANRYYGVDRQYFTTAVDYGFSKRLDEAIEKWGREHVLREVVWIIRMVRPLVIISRFQGNDRDGHGNHQAAGLITREAFKAAGDAAMFPEQVTPAPGSARRAPWPPMTPWQPLKLYMGGVRENEDWTIRVDTGAYDPVLGDSYQTLARLGLSFQRSQNSGRFAPQFGASRSYYKRLESLVDAPEKEGSFFDGIDVTIPGMYRAFRKDTPPHAQRLLAEIDGEIHAAVNAFRWTDPSAAAPPLARALAATRRLKARSDADVRVVLARKEQQLQEAITAALGLVVTAVAQPTGSPEAAGPFAPRATMGPLVPAQTFDIRTTLLNRSPIEVEQARVGLEVRGNWMMRGEVFYATARQNQPVTATVTVTVPDHAQATRLHLSRASIQESRYTVDDEGQNQFFLPRPEPPVAAIGHYEINGVRVDVRRPVTRLEPNLPYGYETREVAIVPAISITLTPEHAIVPLHAASKAVTVKAEVLNNRDEKVHGSVALELPAGWSAPSQKFEFTRAGERALYTFRVSVPRVEDRPYRIGAVAAAGDRRYTSGYTTIRHRDLETRYLYRDAMTSVRGVDVAIAPGLKVGYVMGVGDEVPSGLAQLGVDVQLLGASDLATGDLSRFDAIMTGTRAYAVREDLETYNRRLLDYARDGGNLIVLYNTQELIPSAHAPYPGELPRTAEEVSEEDSPVEILAPEHPLFNTPNRITKADFDGWVEQRGSKFWTSWDSRYTPMIATWDKGQSPQRGGWLHTRYGKGHYTYFAYALHRQLPYGVPGAYRLLANLLSLE